MQGSVSSVRSAHAFTVPEREGLTSDPSGTRIHFLCKAILTSAGRRQAFPPLLHTLDIRATNTEDGPCFGLSDMASGWASETQEWGVAGLVEEGWLGLVCEDRIPTSQSADG